MNKLLPLCLSAALLTGCVSTAENIDTSPTNQATGEVQAASSFSSIEWKPLSIPSSVIFKLNAQSQALQSTLSAGPVAAFSVPANRGAITIQLKSFANSTIYAPTVVILNENNEIIEQFDTSLFVYKPASMLDDDMLEGNFTFIPQITDKEVRILILTKPGDLQQSTELLHPAKAFAIARHTVPPEIPNPIAQHSPYGSFYLHVSSPQIDNAAVSFSKPVVDQAPTTVETQGYYLNSIQTAVNNGDISKAMKLLDEAELLGIKDAKETFIKAVEAKK
ncbi:MalM family protein [Photobacterium sp.]|uniref:MalM family protein n=1 Tax=Photobacterium sp. TaxID=660 RepID=UPI00299EEDD6|nr:MalM family protein [Photobacterium sp.]MDX1302150.1 MalM family protein [Photobacterium sp.]